jgi:hypothetical protein
LSLGTASQVWTCPACRWEEGDNPERPTPVEIFQQLFARDPDFVAALLDLRVSCNDAVISYEYVFADYDRVGVLGLINGVLVALGMTRVAAQYDEEGKLVGFQEYNLRRL